MINNTDINHMIDNDVELIRQLDTNNHVIMYNPSRGFRPTIFEKINSDPLEYRLIMEIYPDLATRLIDTKLYWNFIHK